MDSGIFRTLAAVLAQVPTTQSVDPVKETAHSLLQRLLGVPRQAWIALVAVVVAWIVLARLWRGLRRWARRGRPAQIHPSLQRYNVDWAEVQRRQRELAVGIIATSTSNRLAGYRLVRQVEAVFVEGYTSPEDALIALKAASVERGANALLNVQTQRTAAGKCTASADAVVVAPLMARLGPATGGPPASTGRGRLDGPGSQEPPGLTGPGKGPAET